MRFERVEAGIYELELAQWQRDLMGALGSQLRDLLLEGSSPVLQRIYPTAYPDDVEANDGYTAMVHDQLLESRLAALDTVEAHVEAEGPQRLSDDDVHDWMQAINSLRLTLGTRLDVSEEDDYRDLDEDDPDYGLWMMYDVLSQMLGLIIDRVSA